MSNFDRPTIKNQKKFHLLSFERENQRIFTFESIGGIIALKNDKQLIECQNSYKEKKGGREIESCR